MIGRRDTLNCEEVLARLWEFLDGELDSEQESAVQEHLELCHRCYPQYDFRRAYFEFTRRVQEQHVASPELRQRVFLALLEGARQPNGRES